MAETNRSAPASETRREEMDEQYGDDRNLAARQSLYAYRRPGPSLFDWALDLADLSGDERIVDVGCGNGLYLAALSGRGHGGPVHGLDLETGMLHAAAGWHADAGLVTADAQALPLAGGSVDVAMAMHMLYHVPDQEAAAAELRRVVRPGGVALVVTNAVGHLRELDDLVAGIAGTRPLRAMLTFTMESGEAVLRTAFDGVDAHHFVSGLDVTEAAAVAPYLASTKGLYGLFEEDRVAAALDAVVGRVDAAIDRDGVFPITTATGCFVCR
jgi:SAM-dependent methyltransferase